MKNCRLLIIIGWVMLFCLSNSIIVSGAGDPAELFTREPMPYSEEWGSEIIGYTTVPKLHEYFRTYTPHGLNFQTSWLVANVSDKEGNKYNLLRAYETGSTVVTLASQEVKGLDARAKPIFKKGEMISSRIFFEMDEENGFIYVRPLPHGDPAFSVVIRPQNILWKDANGRIDLEFNATAPAFEFYTPGKLEDFLYRSEPCFVKGKLDGKDVSGYGVFDTAWGPSGVAFSQSKVYTILEKHWTTWLNVYDDDAMEGGNFIDGEGQWRICYHHKNGKAMVYKDCTFDVTHTDDGFVKDAVVTMDGLKFKYNTETRMMRGQGGVLVTWASGRMINVEEAKKPVNTYAWWEFFRKSKK